MNIQTRNLRKAAILSAATFALGLMLGFGVKAEEPAQKPMSVLMIEGCLSQGGFVLSRIDEKTGKTIYVTFQCRVAFESEKPPTGKPAPNNFPTGPNQMI